MNLIIKEDELYKLPPNWEWTFSGYICKSVRDGTHDTPKYIPKGIPLVTSKNLKNGVINFDNVKYISELDYKEIEKRSSVESNDVLFSMIGTIGNPVVVNKKQSFSIKNVGLFKKNESAINPTYLKHWLDSLVFGNWLKPKLRGTTQKFAPLGLLRELPIPLPPILEQARIVYKVEELFSELDKGIESLKTAKAQLAVYRQALLKDAFEGKLTEQWRSNNADKLESPEQLLKRIQQERELRYQQQLDDWKEEVNQWEANGKEGKKPTKPKKYIPSEINKNEKLMDLPQSWECVKFSELLFSIRGGTTIPPIDQETKYPVLRSSSVRQSHINYSDIRYISEEKNTKKADFIEQGDLLFSRLNGSIEFVGNCALVKENHPLNLIYPDRLYCAKLVNTALSGYSELFFSSPEVRNAIEKKAKSTAGHKRISIPDVTDQVIPIPSLEEVKLIVDIVDEKLSVVIKLIENINNDIERSELLKQSILKKAFSGKLVAQDPDDEPASELLKKIAIEKAELAEKEKADKAAAKKAKAEAKKAKA